MGRSQKQRRVFSTVIDSSLSDEELSRVCNVGAEKIRQWRNGEGIPWPGLWGAYARCIFVGQRRWSGFNISR